MIDHVPQRRVQPIYRRLRAQAPVHFNPEYGFWSLSRYSDVAAGMKDFETFSSAEGITLDMVLDPGHPKPSVPMIIMMDHGPARAHQDAQPGAQGVHPARDSGAGTPWSGRSSRHSPSGYPPANSMWWRTSRTISRSK
ncbi:hypothetical protein AB0M34_26110 [Nocardia sp. NPDC050193]